MSDSTAEVVMPIFDGSDPIGGRGFWEEVERCREYFRDRYSVTTPQRDEPQPEAECDT